MAKPVRLGEKKFATMTAATAHFREILNRNEITARISDEKLEEDDLRKLLAFHPDVKEKIGVGVDWFYVDVSPDHPTRCFWIRRIDGSVVDFSFMVALKAAGQLSA